MLSIGEQDGLQHQKVEGTVKNFNVVTCVQSFKCQASEIQRVVNTELQILLLSYKRKQHGSNTYQLSQLAPKLARTVNLTF